MSFLSNIFRDHPSASVSDAKEAQSDAVEVLELLGHSAGVGLWNAAFHEGDPVHEKSFWQWSVQFARLLGFEGGADFPNKIETWSDRLHPDDVAPTFAAFGAFLKDTSGRTPYDVLYRCKVRSGTYRWFRAIGGCLRDPTGMPLRACGSLIDIHAEQELRENVRALVEVLRGTASKVAVTSSEMQSSAGELSAAAEVSAHQSSTVASVASEISTNVETVSQATWQFSESISEIGHQVEKSAQIAGAAVSQAAQAGTTIDHLNQVAQRIGDVAKLIQDIASQTNLLALNATIEAARAGAAGKGFAVVANEVKTLANQTTKATGDISAQISSIQEATGQAVVAIREIGGTIRQIDETCNAVAAAVQEQSATTQSIAANMGEVSAGTQEILKSIAEASEGAKQTSRASHQVTRSSQDLSSEAENLRSEIDRLSGILAK